MSRRRLRLICSSDEEEEENQIPQQPETENPNPNPNLVPDPYPSEPLEISDDGVEEEEEEFIDVSDNFTPPDPDPNPNPDHHSAQQTPATNSAGEGSGFREADVSDNSAQPNLAAGGGEHDSSGSGSPIGDFLGRLGLRLKNESLEACLDALRSSVPGFASLGVDAKAKLCFERFLVSDMNQCGSGALPRNVDSMHLVDLAGPFVLQIDEIVNISCPLKGRYEKAPPGIKRCLKLSMTDGVQRVFGMEYRPIQALESLAPAGLKVAICNVHIRHGLLMLVPEAFEVLGGLVEELEAARLRLVDEINKPPRGRRTRSGVVPPLATRATLAAWPSNGVSAAVHNNSSTLQDATPFRANNQGATSVLSGTNTSQRTTEEFTDPATVENAVPNTSSSVISGLEEMHIDTFPFSRENAVPNPSSHTVSTVSEVEDVHMVDEADHPVILSGDREIPFTYLASLSAKLVAVMEKSPSVQGKIKCFLTGVKGFQYKQRTTYELRAYVDDGSLITEILIHHDVVQKGIGFSPEEVTAALSSPDKKIVSDMKETLKQFQMFLANFEGTMLIEMSTTSPQPIALEMNEGCTESDAWLLLRRLNSTVPAQTPHHSSLDPIDVSP
ncbi:recQ-mediated genome instability protein 1 [Quercus suber]|uniref:RecQ-mediated genome instability protein 1 n=1 Tax=Quercus suber TaxID=58331 RepID=A0AAW0LPW0_QUESU|nr:recQ-mediated genome instability protein 1 [Quercus suber]POE64466.1 recq-mediated genome instability protein 1 [Quercus suber]